MSKYSVAIIGTVLGWLIMAILVTTVSTGSRVSTTSWANEQHARLDDIERSMDVANEWVLGKYLDRHRAVQGRYR